MAFIDHMISQNKPQFFEWSCQWSKWEKEKKGFYVYLEALAIEDVVLRATIGLRGLLLIEQLRPFSVTENATRKSKMVK